MARAKEDREEQRQLVRSIDLHRAVEVVSGRIFGID
jgi:hypothetical protein